MILDFVIATIGVTGALVALAKNDAWYLFVGLILVGGALIKIGWLA